MAINCNGCTRKHDSIAQGHCTEFSVRPQIDACDRHSEGVTASSGRTGEYRWLNQAPGNEVTTPKQPSQPL